MNPSRPTLLPTWPAVVLPWCLVWGILSCSTSSDSSDSGSSITDGAIDTGRDLVTLQDAPEQLDQDPWHEASSSDAPAGCFHPTVTMSCQDGWCTIPPGCFLMGSPAGELCREPKGEVIKETQHQVTLTHSYEISAHEVTQAKFLALMEYNAAQYPECGGDCPVDSVTWHEAAAYCNALSTAKGLAPCYTCQGKEIMTDCTPRATYQQEQVYSCPGYRLPTEAEWEYAYRAGTQTAFYNGDITTCEGSDTSADLIGWYWQNSGSTPHPVGLKEPNAWGLYDMAGNIGELIHDWLQEDLQTAAVVDPWGAPKALTKVRRGGSFLADLNSGPGRLRAAYRGSSSDVVRNATTGFRCVRSL